MARKSRRKSAVPDAVQEAGNSSASSEEEKLRTAAHIRLSVEQETDDTIETQMALVTEFIREQDDLALKEIYVDNGYTGTNFDRPEFQRLMTDCKNGTIQCIVVKDFSRFGRNFIEAAYYIETFFSKIHVRFLSINDNFDSFREEDMRNIVTPLKLLINEMYAKDTGKKIRKVMENKRNDGTQKIGTPAFGYQVDRKKNQYVVDPEAAAIVQLIFHWFLHGKSEAEIAASLRAIQMPTPYQLMKKEDDPAPSESKKDWTPSKVRNILKNRTYCGDRALGKRLLGKFPDESKSYEVPEEEWVIWENTHEPIVLRIDYELVKQKIKDAGTLVYQEAVRTPFSGKVVCGLCGWVMTYGHYKNDFFYRDTKVRNKNGCGNKIHTDYLKVVVMDQIQRLIQTICEKKVLLDHLKEDVSCKKKIQSCRRRLLFIKTKREKVLARIEQVFTDHAEGLLGDLDFSFLKEKFMQEKHLLDLEEEKVIESEKKQNQIMEQICELERWLRPYLDDHRYNQELVNALVDTITVYGTERIEITFTCKDVFTDFADWFEEAVL